MESVQATDRVITALRCHLRPNQAQRCTCDASQPVRSVLWRSALHCWHFPDQPPNFGDPMCKSDIVYCKVCQWVHCHVNEELLYIWSTGEQYQWHSFKNPSVPRLPRNVLCAFWLENSLWRVSLWVVQVGLESSFLSYSLYLLKNMVTACVVDLVSQPLCYLIIIIIIIIV